MVSFVLPVDIIHKCSGYLNNVRMIITWPLTLYIMWFFITTLWGFIKFGKIINLNFICGFSFLMTLTTMISSFIPATRKIKKTKLSPKRNFIILKPREWMFIYETLKHELPDYLIRIVIDYSLANDCLNDINFKNSYMF